MIVAELGKWKLMATLPKSFCIASNWFSTEDLSQFQISNIFVLPCVANVSRIIPRKVQYLCIHLQLIDSIECFFLAEDSVEVWKIIENSRRSRGGAPAGARGCPVLRLTRCHEWQWLRPNMDG